MSEFNKTTPISREDLWEGLRGETTPRWYVIHTYSGHEAKVKANIEKMVENRGMQDLILSIVVPTEDKAEPKDGKLVVKTKKIFPGYVIVKMVVTNASWYLVRNTQGVTGFVGHGSNPIPLTDEEVRRMGIERVHIDLQLKPGDEIRVIKGAFAGNQGIVDEVDENKEIVRARLTAFGRQTPAELDFADIDKI